MWHWSLLWNFRNHILLVYCIFSIDLSIYLFLSHLFLMDQYVLGAYIYNFTFYRVNINFRINSNSKITIFFKFKVRMIEFFRNPFWGMFIIVWIVNMKKKIIHLNKLLMVHSWILQLLNEVLGFFIIINLNF